MGVPIPGVRHTFIILTDTVTGKQYATRAGKVAVGAGKSVLYAETSSWPPSGSFSDKPNEILKSQDVGTLPYPFDNVVSATETFARRVNNAHMEYDQDNVNSNTYSSDYMYWFRLTKPDVPSAPGYDDKLPFGYTLTPVVRP
jgi:hypothetical protein